MTDLSSYQFEINGYVFGLDCDIATDGDGFDQGIDEFTSQDVGNVFNDSLDFGVDSVAPSAWAWTLHTDLTRFDDDALAVVEPFAKAWNDRKLRRTPGAVVALRYCVAHRTRVVYGRPRAFNPALLSSLAYGLIPLNVEFQRADTLHYADEVQTFQVANASQPTVGFTAPITTPFTTIEGTPTTSTLPPFAGDEDAPFEVTFVGPATNPKLYTDDWEIQINVVLEAGESVTVSTYPWGERAVRNDGVRLPGILSMGTRLSKARLSPDGEALRFSAIDSTGEARCDIAWRAAHSTI